jgi:Zn-dependent peptidase ImmA (M78 family)
MTKIPSRARYDHALNYAHNFLLLQQITSFPIDPFEIVVHNGWRVLKAQEVADMTGLSREDVLMGKEADCWYGGGKYTIIYDDNIQSLKRIRWSIMHEIGHIFLNHHIDFHEQLHYRKQLKPGHYRALERETNTFVAEVMAPISVIKHCELFHTQSIMNTFDISYEAASIQLDNLNYQGHKPFYRETDQYMVINFWDYISKINPYFKPPQAFYF